MGEEMILGIDVSKETVDVALFAGKEALGRGQFANTAAGFKKLSKWLSPWEAKAHNAEGVTGQWRVCHFGSC